MRLAPPRSRLALLALALALLFVLGAAALAALVAYDERFERKFDEVARSLGFTGEDELAERFSKSMLAGSSSLRPTVLQFGPDGRLYVAQQDGLIKAYTIVREDAGAYRVTATETISVVHDLPNHDDDGRLNPRVRGRQVTGMVVAGIAASPLLYVSSSDPRIGGGDDGDGHQPRHELGRDLAADARRRAWRRLDLVRGLPRSEELHSTNGLALSADGTTLYVAQGSNANAGAPSQNFAQAAAVRARRRRALGRPERDRGRRPTTCRH